MNLLRIVIISLLLGAVCFPFFSVPSVNSQASTSTTTMTMKEPPSIGQCTMLSLGFLARSGEQIRGTFGSTATISFYILSQSDLNGIQNCRLPASARALFVSEQSVGHDNPYRSLSFPANGTYYFVFTYVRGTTQLTGGYLTVELGIPSSVTIIGASGSSSIQVASTVISPPSTSSLSISTTKSTSNIQSPSTTLMSTSSMQTLSTLTSTVATSASTQAPPASSLAILGYEVPLTSLLLVVGVAIIAGGGLTGGLLVRNRRQARSTTTRALSSYLEKIDSTYNEYAVDREECRTRLEKLKRDAIEMLNSGKLEEGHFLMLDEKISEYLKDLTQTAAKQKPKSGTDETGESGAPSQ
jgi:hypothetical protein